MSFQESVQPQMNKQLTDNLLAAILTRPAAALIDTPTVHLFTAGPTPITANSSKADFTEATFNGYATVPVAPVSASPVNLPSGQGDGIIMTNALFIVSAAGIDNSVLGYMVTQLGTDLKFSEYFPAPVQMVNIGDFIEIAFTMPIGWLTPV